VNSLFSRIAALRSSAPSDTPAAPGAAGLAGPDDSAETRSGRKQRTRVTRRAAAGLSVLCVGALAGTGLVLQPALAAQNDTAVEAEAVAETADRDVAQLEAFNEIARVQAEKAASGTISGATAVITAAQNKVDASDLASTVSMLSNYEQLAPPRIYELVSVTNEKVTPVEAATAEADRIAAEQAAAAQAAAEKAAAEQAAAEQAAPRWPSAPAPSTPSAPSNPSGAQAIARDMMAAKYGWGGDQFGCLVSLWDKESGWNVNAYNASSGATGIPQALPGSKMATAGADWATNAATQISWGLGYISGSYGTPCAAWNKSESVGWY
jgi:hypothetical protein